MYVQDILLAFAPTKVLALGAIAVGSFNCVAFPGLSQAASMFIFCSQRPLSQLQITSCCTVKVCLEEGTLSLSLSLSLSFIALIGMS